MDFFERQDRARRRTGLLVFLFGLAVVGIVAVLYTLAVVGLGTEPLDWEVLAWVAGGTLAVVAAGSLYKISELSQGGRIVAAALGGESVDLNSRDPHIRQLINVVEEMALASGVPVPDIYVLPDRTINAFAAGNTTGDAVVGVTRGCIERLSRDELQGVIAHEFSHILNGDMRLNIRLMGVLNGILCLALLGQFLLRAGVLTRPRSNDRNAGAMVLVFIGGGIALIVVGLIGVFFGKLIKAAVSRQREYLADAAAVQFTRNPGGIAGALYKIGRFTSRITSPHAEEASHMFIGNGLRGSWFSLFATHPPIQDRIQRVAPGFDPSKIEAETRTRRAEVEQRLERRPESVQSRNWSDAVGAPQRAHLFYAAALLASLPDEAQRAAHEMHSACALIYALLLSADDKELREKQLTLLEADEATLAETRRIFGMRDRINPEQEISLVDLAIPTLRQLSPAQYAQLKRNATALIEADGHLHLFEFVLQKILVRHLEMFFTKSRGARVAFRSVLPLAPDCNVVFSALAHVGHESEKERDDSFQAGVRELLLSKNAYAWSRIQEPCVGEVDKALDRMADASPEVKRRILQACGQVVMHDGAIAPYQGQLLRAIADVLDCPIPPFVTTPPASPQ